MDAHIKEDRGGMPRRASDEERATFGEVVKNLAGAGIERYHTDLLRGEKTYYLPDGESEVVKGNAVAATPAQVTSRRRASMRR